VQEQVRNYARRSLVDQWLDSAIELARLGVRTARSTGKSAPEVADSR
jgi:hypothetical protein